MEEKKAFVFDTNFIIKEKKIDEVLTNLSEQYSVYVTQVSVDERIAQQCRELKKRYDEIEQLKEKAVDLVEISVKKTYTDMASLYKKSIQRKYEKAFQDRLIPFIKGEAILEAVIERANQKKPPFITEAKSDKGFKDALIWESMLSYFAENGEQEVLFVTDDNGFIKNEKEICAEFSELTGKSLSIHPNTYYRELLKPTTPEEQAPPKRIPNVNQLREQIESVLFDIRYVEVDNYWGDTRYERTFTTSREMDADYVQMVFDNLKKTILLHLLEPRLPASAIFEFDDRITDTGYMIPMSALESASNLYDEVVEQYSEYTEAFFSAVAINLNQNYLEKAITDYLSEEDGELPF